MEFQRPVVSEIESGLSSPVPFLQVVIGPRQIGKSTAAAQIAEHLGWPTHSASADSAIPHPPEWIETQWEWARRLANSGKSLLILDEIQKVPGWSEVVKRLWDDERAHQGPVRPLLLGSSALLLQRGLTESLSGRFCLHRFTHWTWVECRTAFGWSLDQWIYFGGYPGAAAFSAEEAQWKRYVSDSLIDTVLARDVFQLQTVNKPALLRQLFALAATYPAQIVSYTKMQGQLHDAGNTTTLAHYLQLMETAFLASGLELFSQGKVRKRGSSPKLILWNNALINAVSLRTLPETRRDGSGWGRLVENAVGAHLLNGLQGPSWSVTYWRKDDFEVDFVVHHGTNIWAIEVKSGRARNRGGIEAFRRIYPDAKVWMLGTDGVPLEEFFSKPATAWFT